MANNTAIATVAANVATALTAIDTAETSAASVKFDAIVSFAALVAADVRKVINKDRNAINAEPNLKRDARGRIIALVDASKALRADFAKALTEARGLTQSADDDKRRRDCENIASMGRTVSLHFVKGMIDNGSIRVAKSTDEMAAFIRESLLIATGDVATYNGIELARTRKWEAPEATADDADDATQEAEDVDPFTVEPAPQAEQEPEATPENHGPVIMESADDADKAVSAAIATLRGFMAADDMERLAAFGFRSFLADALEYVRTADEAEAEANAALEANG